MVWPAAPPEPADGASRGARGGGAEPDYRGYATAGIEALQRWYRPRTGLWRTTGWWNAANALTAVIGYMQRTGDHTYLGVIERTFTAAGRRPPCLLRNFYDDNDRR